MSDPIVANVIRSGVVESIHRAAFALSSPDGRILWSGGDIERPTYIRSCSKLFQTLPIITTGAADHFGFTDAELTVMSASHSGEPIHVETVRGIFSKIGMSESALLCGAQPPYSDDARHDIYRSGEPFLPVHNNCSGKHAGMMALALHLGVPVEGYLDPAHPVQVMMKEAYARVAGVPADSVRVGYDGCDAPAFVTTVKDVSIAMARYAKPEVLGDKVLEAAIRRLRTAVIANPFLLGGSKRFCTAFLTATDGNAVSKVGAEAMYVFSDLVHNLGFGIKLNDGNEKGRGMQPFVCAVADKLELFKKPYHPSILPYMHPLTYNYVGRVVGSVEVPSELIASMPHIGR